MRLEGEAMPKFLAFRFCFVPWLVGGAQASGGLEVGEAVPKVLAFPLFFEPMLVGGTQASGASKSGEAMPNVFAIPPLCQCLSSDAQAFAASKWAKLCQNFRKFPFRIFNV